MLQLKRDAHVCGCGGWRWCDTADSKGEKQCIHFGTPFCVAEPFPFNYKRRLST